MAARHAVTLPAVNFEVYGKALLGRTDRDHPAHLSQQRLELCPYTDRHGKPHQ